MEANLAFNGMLFNSEIWIGTTEKDLDDINVINLNFILFISYHRIVFRLGLMDAKKC